MRIRTIILAMTLTIIACILVVLAVSEYSMHSVYGPTLEDKQVMEFLEGEFQEYTLNVLSEDQSVLRSRFSLRPYVSKQSVFPYAYYINDNGLIRRGSEAEKVIDKKFEEEKADHPYINPYKITTD